MSRPPAVLRPGSAKQYEKNAAGGQKIAILLIFVPNPAVIHIKKSDGPIKTLQYQRKCQRAANSDLRTHYSASSLTADSSACAKEETLDQATLHWDPQLIVHLIWSHGKCKRTTVNPKHCIKLIPYWMTADYGSEKCTMRQLSTLFKMQSVHIVDYGEGHLPILHTSLLIWAGNWKSQRRTRKQKKDTNSRNSSSFHFQSTNHAPMYYRCRVLYSSKKPADHRPWNKTKLVQFTREICDAYRKEKDNELWGWRIFSPANSWLEVGCWIFPAHFFPQVSFPTVSPQGVIVRLLRECVYSHFAPISMLTLWKQDAFSPGAKPTSCKLRIAAVRWTRSQRPPSTCVRGKIQPRV